MSNVSTSGQYILLLKVKDLNEGVGKLAKHSRVLFYHFFILTEQANVFHSYIKRYY